MTAPSTPRTTPRALGSALATRAALRCTLAIALSACGATAPPVEVRGEPIRYEARVVAARGLTMAERGGTCRVEVQAADGLVLNCRIRIRCNGDLVYGLAGAGYNRCRREGERVVFAHDTHGTRRDGDPRMFFDIETGRIVISDDDPDVEVLLDLMHRPNGYEAPPR